MAQLGPSRKQLGLGNNKTPFNPFGVPRTQGDFNQQLYQAAQSQYQPQLQAVQGDVNSEKAANQQRTSGLNNIYGAYQNQATDAFNRAQDALHQLITQNTTTNDAARGTLQAALQASGQNTDALSRMLGGEGNANTPSAQPYDAAALALNTIGNNALTNSAAASTEAQSGSLFAPGQERAQMLNQESKRHLVATQSLENNRRAVLAQIPGIIEKARENLIQQIQSGEGLAFQQDLANRQFGLQQEGQQFTQGLQTKQFGEQQKVDQANIDNQKAQNEIQKILAGNSVAKDTAALQNELNKAKSQQEANALAQLTEWLKPTANELQPGGTHTVTNADGSKTTTHTGGGINPKTWHRDVGAELDLLMTQFGLSQQRALQLMYGITTPIGGSQGSMTIGQWAKTFLQRQKDRRNTSGSTGSYIGGAVGAGGLGHK